MPDIAEPPVAPAAAPDSPAPATPEAAPVAAPSPSPATKAWTDAWDALDLPDAPAPKPEPPKAAPAKDAKPDAKPDEPAPAKPDAKPDAKPTEPVPDADGVPQFRTNKELNRWARERHKAAATAEVKLAEQEAKLKELETRAPKTEQGAEVLAQQIAESEKKIAHYEQILESQSFENSAKYQKEYADPYHHARQAAYKEVAEMAVNEPTGQVDEEGNPTFRQRPATKADFDKIYSLPRVEARELAKKLFGEDAGDVMDHRKRISELADKAREAIEDRRQNFSKYKQQEMAQKSQQDIALNGLWKTANEKISQDPKRAMYWGEDKDDPDANKALANGFKLADEFFSEKRENMDTADKVEFDAYIRHTIAMGPKLAYKLNKAMAENQALKDEVAQLRGSAPGTPKPISEEQAPAPKGFYEQLNELPD